MPSNWALKPFGAMLVIDHHLGEAEFITIDNTPHDYKEIFVKLATRSAGIR